MVVVVTGASGMLGGRVVRALAERGELVTGDGGARPIERIVAADVVCPAFLDDQLVVSLSGDLADPVFAREVVADGTEAIFHLAGVVSGAAEADFDLGYRANLDGTRNLLEAARALGNAPRIVFTSSIAAYGGDFASVVPDDQRTTPQTSYGVQKVIGELLVADYTRKGFVRGRSVRLPNIVVRPGAPNAAASGFTSSIIREPLAGLPAVCPVDPDVRCALLSPQRAVPALIRALELPQEVWGHDPVVNLPSITVSAGEIAEAVRRAGGSRAYDLIEFKPDPKIVAMFTGWPSQTASLRARAMGFSDDGSIDDVIAAHLAEQ